ncbi:replication initiator [Microbispora sp. ZYX-F-249]|uniref:Replication initiator n=1 Tax=Microbispora maris TaxID=3144104 RepID=A0ABV0AS52_9ACTN
MDVPCGATLESKCPPCAKRNRQLRRAQCREGWHLDHDPNQPSRQGRRRPAPPRGTAGRRANRGAGQGWPSDRESPRSTADRRPFWHASGTDVDSLSSVSQQARNGLDVLTPAPGMIVRCSTSGSADTGPYG